MSDDRSGEARLVERARGGDVAAFTVLFRRHRDVVYGLCLRLAPERRQAEEIALEAFTAAWSGLDGFRGDSRFSTWVCSIASNLCRIRLRQSRRRRDRFAPMDRVSGEAEAMPVQKTEVRLDLERALASLPERARTTIVLRHIHGFSLREVADAMDVSVGTVKSQLWRACALMRERLSDD